MPGHRSRTGALRRVTHLGRPDAARTMGKPIDAQHRADLEADVDMLRAAITLQRHTNFGDPHTDEQHNRASFLAHFPDLDSLLQEWDELIEAAKTAPGSLWEYLQQATSDRGLTEPPFALGRLVDRLATLTLQRARQGQLDTRHELQFQRFTDRTIDGTQRTVYVEGQNVLALPDEPTPGVQEQIEAAEQRIQALFDDAQASAQAQFLASAISALHAAEQPILDRLATHASGEEMTYAAGCPVCQAQPGADAPG